MDPLMGLTQAARLAGVSRAHLQQQIAQGRLPSFEGKVRLSDLSRVYPDVRLPGSAMVDVVARHREDAVHKGVRSEEGGPTQSVDVELSKLRRERNFYRQRNASYREALRDLQGMLDQAYQRLEPRQRPYLEAVNRWLAHKLRELR